jgi:hypothetical protein
VTGGLPRRKRSPPWPLALMARISTTAPSTHSSWPGHTGTAQRKQGGRVSGASTHRSVSGPNERMESMSALS